MAVDRRYDFPEFGGYLGNVGFNACAANGGADWDHSAMVRALAIMAGHEVG